MAGPNEITVKQGGGNSGVGHAVEREQRSKGFQITEDPSDIENGISNQDSSIEPKRRGSGNQRDGQMQETHSGSEHLYARSYERHYKGSEAFTENFVKARDKDLNVILITVSLLSAVISTFIVYIHPQLQADPNEESAALLRVLLYKTDNTGFGGDVPEVPRWTGPPTAVVAALLLLYLSLAVKLGSGLFAILPKQLLNLYALAGTSGSNLEGDRTQGRRLKWFAVGLHGTVLLLLSLALQNALFLLGCALTAYIWNINCLIASFALHTAVVASSLYFFLLAFGLADVGYSHYLRSRGDNVSATKSSWARFTIFTHALELFIYTYLSI